MNRKDLLNIKIQTQRIDKVYNIKKDSKLGKGNFGVVVKGKDKVSGQIRAIKIVKIEKLASVDADLKTLEREFQIMRGMDHPNIVKLYEVYKDEKYIYFVMEYLDGKNLYEGFIRDNHTVNESQIRDIFYQIMKAIQYMHNNGIAHRDIKPENVMFIDRKGSNKIKLIDFGVSKYFFDQENPKKEITMRTKAGSLFYFSPEIAGNNKRYDHKVDIWSAGVLLYLMVSGEPPFFDMNPIIVIEKVKKMDYHFNESIWKNVSKELIHLIKNLLAPLKVRYSAEKVLEHPWMKMNMEGKVKTDLKSARNFFHGAQLGRYVKEMITAMASETDVNDLGKIFVEIDEDGDGIISREELIFGIETYFSFNNEEFIESINKNFKENEKINYVRFLTLMTSVNDLPDFEKRVEKVFRLLDRKKKKQVTAKEIKRLMGKMKLYEKKSLDFWQECVDEVDKNQKGYLDLDDFKNMLKYN